VSSALRDTINAQAHVCTHGQLHTDSGLQSHILLSGWAASGLQHQGIHHNATLPDQQPCSHAEFEEPRVIDLWDLAQSANFTEKELESFRVSEPQGSAALWLLQWQAPLLRSL
jgi:hypothetical protein